jgi:hypothetical protein
MFGEVLPLAIKLMKCSSSRRLFALTQRRRCHIYYWQGEALLAEMVGLQLSEAHPQVSRSSIKMTARGYSFPTASRHQIQLLAAQ